MAGIIVRNVLHDVENAGPQLIEVQFNTLVCILESLGEVGNGEGTWFDILRRRLVFLDSEMLRAYIQ